MIGQRADTLDAVLHHRCIHWITQFSGQPCDSDRIGGDHRARSESLRSTVASAQCPSLCCMSHPGWQASSGGSVSPCRYTGRRNEDRPNPDFRRCSHRCSLRFIPRAAHAVLVQPRQAECRRGVRSRRSCRFRRSFATPSKLLLGQAIGAGIGAAVGLIIGISTRRKSYPPGPAALPPQSGRPSRRCSRDVHHSPGRRRRHFTGGQIPRPVNANENNEGEVEMRVDTPLKFVLPGVRCCVVRRRGDGGPGAPQSHRPAADLQHVSGDTTSRCPNWRRTQRKPWPRSLLDQQVRDIEIGKAHVGIGMVYRGKLDEPAAELGRRARSGQRGLSHHLRHSDAGARPGYHQPAAPSGDAADRCRVQRAGKQRIGYPERRGPSAEGGRRRGDSGGHGTLVHEDRRSHQLPDGAHRSRQGDAARDEAESKAY